MECLIIQRKTVIDKVEVL